MSRTDPLRQAVSAGDWPAVLRLWEAYAKEIENEIARRECTPARLAEADEFLAWSRRTILCARTQAQTTLNALQAAKLYETAPPRTRTTVRKTL